MRPFCLLAACATTAIVATAGAGLAAAGPPPASTAVVDLGAPAGIWASQAAGISAQGTVGGTLVLSASSPVSHAAVWSAAGWRDLGNGTVLGMTDAGDAVGYTGPVRQPRAAVWDVRGQLHDLGTLPGGVWSQATAANNHGAVVGYAQSGTSTHAFVGKPGQGLEDLGASAAGPSYAYGIDDAGHVVGSVAGQAVVWDPAGQPTDLGAGASSVAYAINRRGLVVGSANGRAFAWSSSTGVEDLPGTGPSTALAVNANGSVVGSALVSSGTGLPTLHAVLWQAGRVCDLNALLPSGSGWELGSATAINDRGEIVGTGVHQGQPRGFLLPLADADAAACLAQ